jgi:hypothetical protein
VPLSGTASTHSQPVTSADGKTGKLVIGPLFLRCLSFLHVQRPSDSVFAPDVIYPYLESYVYDSKGFRRLCLAQRTPRYIAVISLQSLISRLVASIFPCPVLLFPRGKKLRKPFTKCNRLQFRISSIAMTAEFASQAPESRASSATSPKETHSFSSHK